MISRSATTTEQLIGAASRPWDVVIVGAGPAGAIAARQIARRGVSVLLVDKAVFPRPKVCGCCLSARGVAALEQIGLDQVLPALGGIPLRRAVLATTGRSATLRIPAGGAIVSREALDAALVQQAVDAGVELLQGTTAKLAGWVNGSPQIDLSTSSACVRISPSLVVAADGLQGGFLDGAPCFRPIVAAKSRIGIGGISQSAADFCESGVITMAIGDSGYVGTVRLPDGRLDVAAAMDRECLRPFGPGGLVRRIISEAGLPWSDVLAGLKWQGTPPLTRRLPKVATDRVFVVGDAAGYVEPFTGEGMTWAILSGIAVAPIVAGAVLNYSEAAVAQWRHDHRRLLAGRMMVCRAIGGTLRSPSLRRISMAAVAKGPVIANTIARYVAGPRRGALA